MSLNVVYEQFYTMYIFFLQYRISLAIVYKRNKILIDSASLSQKPGYKMVG